MVVSIMQCYKIRRQVNNKEMLFDIISNKNVPGKKY